MSRLKVSLKKNRRILAFYNFLFARPIVNINRRSFSKRALLSYSVYPFIKKNRRLIHPNYIEIYKLNKILDELEYNVDIYNNNFDGKIHYQKYDLIIGEGLPISNYFMQYTNRPIKTVYYATGSHPIFNNNQSFKKLCEFYKKSHKWMDRSSRIVDARWALGASLSDSFIVIGNEVTKSSFLDYTGDSNIFLLNPPFYQKVFNVDLSRKSRKKFLWFGSYGLLHKGLDTVIETFLNRKEVELHICGYLDGESEFIDFYRDRIAKSQNIFLHGFVNLESDLFKELMEECCFVLLTSVAEGLATAVITAMGNGGLIPVITKETGIDLSLGIQVETQDVKSLNQAIDEAEKLSDLEILQKSQNNLHYIQTNFNEVHFENELRSILIKICAGDKKDG